MTIPLWIWDAHVGLILRILDGYRGPPPRSEEYGGGLGRGIFGEPLREEEDVIIPGERMGKRKRKRRGGIFFGWGNRGGYDRGIVRSSSIRPRENYLFEMWKGRYGVSEDAAPAASALMTETVNNR